MVQNKIKHFTYYLRRMMKFYDLKANAVPQVLFVLFLTVSFGIRVLAQPIMLDYSIYFQQLYNTLVDVFAVDNLNNQLQSMIEFQSTEVFTRVLTISLKVIGIVTLQQILMRLLAFFYLGGYLCDLETQSSSFASYVKKFVKALPRYILFNIVFYCAVIAILGILLLALSFGIIIFPMFGFVLNFIMLLIPIGWFIIQVIFIFKDITFLDTGVSVWRNFKISLQLSKGYRFMIARNIIFISILSMLIGMFTFESQLVSIFIASFFEVIILQIRQRLVALMYISRTRKPKEDLELNKVEG